jgi:kumamolisin
MKSNQASRKNLDTKPAKVMAAAWVLGLSFLVSATAQAKTQTAVLRFQEKMSIESLAQLVISGKSPLTRPYTTAEIRQIVGPDEEDYQTTIENLKLEGFQIVSESPSRLSVTVSADESVFNEVFGTQTEMTASGARKVVAEASIPSHLSLIERVAGLGGAPRRPHLSVEPMAGGLLPSPSQGLDRNTIAALYGFKGIYDAGYDGSGQHIAIATYGDVNLDAVRSLYNYYHLSPMPTVDKVTFNGTPDLQDDPAMETSLDAEFSGMIAPGAAVHIYTSAANDDGGELAMFTRILDDGIAPVVNYSWGGCEAEMNSGHGADMNKVFARAVAQGVNITVASGDNGSNSCGAGTPQAQGQNLPTVDADWPAANPYVVAVGGTSISQVGGKYKETAWTGSGGGVSKIWAKPAYQNGMTTASMRAYPDVSFNADPKASGEPVFVIYKGQQGWAPIGGTSMAAPQWAGLLTLINAAREKHGKARIGFLNPLLYGMKANVFTVIRDITSGTNGAFKAATGYDEVTGLGSPKADNLFTALVQMQ